MASISLGLGALLGGALGATGSVVSGVLGSSAAETAASEQAQQEQNAIQLQQQIFGQQQQNIEPFLAGGQQNLSTLMSQFQNGTFGAGSLPPVPTAPGPFTTTFTPPTLAQAEQAPGYQFQAQQGEKGVLEAAAAGGGAISGGTLNAAGQYQQNLAQTDYNNVFNQALSTYGTALQGYQANLAGYGQQLAGYQTQAGAQQQAFGQELAPITLGENAASSLNNTSTQAAQNLTQLLTSLGATQAAGTVGSTNAITGAISNATGNASQALLLSQLLPLLSPQSTPSNLASLPVTNNPVNPANIFNYGPPINYGGGPG
jgi:hypothetical protein